MPQLFDVRGAAQRLAISYHSVYRLVERGLIRHVKIGNSVRFTEAQLDEFIASRTIQPVGLPVGLGAVA